MTREEAIAFFKDMNECTYGNLEAVEMAIKALEQEPKRGHWILTIEDWNKWTCSECGFKERTDIHVTLGYRFCPKCGAKMGEEE